MSTSKYVKNTINLIPGLFISLLFTACNSTRHEMPITTSSEEARELFYEGRELWENDEPIRADSIFSKAIDCDPELGLAHLWRQYNAGVPKAIQLINQLNPGEALMIKAYDAYLNADFLLCQILVDSLLELYPRDKHCLLFAGTLWKEQDEMKAIEYYNQAIDLDPYYAAPYGSIARMNLQLKNYEEAEKACVRFLELKPRSGNAMALYGDLLREIGKEEEALLQYRRAAQIEPRYSFTYIPIIWIYIRQGNYDQARVYCDILSKAGQRIDNKDEPFTVDDRQISLYLMSIISYIQYDLAGSLEFIDQVIEIQHNEENMTDQLFSILMKAWYALEGGSPELALTILSNGLDIADQAEIDLSHKMARILWIQGTMSLCYGTMREFENAEKHLNEARKIYNTLDHTVTEVNFMNLFEAAMAINKGDYGLAISQLQLSADRTSVSCQYYLAKAYDLAGNFEQAIKYYRMTYQSVNYTFTGFFFNKAKKRLEELTR